MQRNTPALTPQRRWVPLLATPTSTSPRAYVELRRVTQLDLDLAAKLDAVEVDYSPKWLREHNQKTANP